MPNCLLILLIFSLFMQEVKRFRSFRYRGAVLWNSFSYEAKTARSIYSFKGLIQINIHVFIQVISCVGWGVFLVMG